jgi:hypothetical protein
VAAKDQPVSLHLHVGDKFASERERPHAAKATRSFAAHHAGGVTDLAKSAEDGKLPAATYAPARAGSHVIALARDWQHIQLEAAKFNDYLREEGLEAILDARRKAGQDNAAGRERYSRYIKCLIQVGDASDDTPTKPVGHLLEIVPVTHPLEKKPTGALAVRILFEGKPLANATWAAYHRNGNKVTVQRLKTSAEGKATVDVREPGVYLLRLVHMRPCRGVEGIDWESYWASFAFEMR